MDFEGVKINNHVVADDQINLAKDKVDFQVISELFQYYQKIYKLQFGWAKTELNIYGTQDPDADAKEVMFGGHRMKLSEGYTHLGLLVTNDIKNTDSINVSNRCSAAERSFWSTLGAAIREVNQMSFYCIKKTMTTMVIPSLLAGLSALVLQKKQLQKLDSFQKKIWRRVFGLHKNAPINMILWISGMPSPTILWELQVLSLFWNVWTIPRM